MPVRLEFIPVSKSISYFFFHFFKSFRTFAYINVGYVGAVCTEEEILRMMNSGRRL